MEMFNNNLILESIKWNQMDPCGSIKVKDLYGSIWLPPQGPPVVPGTLAEEHCTTLCTQYYLRWHGPCKLLHSHSLSFCSRKEHQLIAVHVSSPWCSTLCPTKGQSLALLLPSEQKTIFILFLKLAKALLAGASHRSFKSSRWWSTRSFWYFVCRHWW